MSNSIDVNQLLAQMRSMAIQAQQKPDLGENMAAGQANFASLLQNSIENVNAAQQHAGGLAQAFQAGDSKVDLNEVMVSLQKASISFQAMSQVRNKLVSAYQEIMSMPM